MMLQPFPVHLISEAHILYGTVYQLATTLKPLTGDVSNINHIIEVQGSDWKP